MRPTSSCKTPKLLSLLFVFASCLYFSRAVPLTYAATPALEFIFTPLNEAWNGAYAYQREMITNGPRLYFGKLNDAGTNFPRPNRLFNGNIFEGEEIDVAEPHANLNMGTNFALGMWI